MRSIRILIKTAANQHFKYNKEITETESGVKSTLLTPDSYKKMQFTKVNHFLEPICGSIYDCSLPDLNRR